MSDTYQLGSKADTMVDLGTAPRAEFQSYGKTIEVNHGLKGVGFPVVTWRWEELAIPERDDLVRDLREWRPIERFIRTQLPDGSWAVFHCLQHPPESGRLSTRKRKIVDFSLRFTHCIRVE